MLLWLLFVGGYPTLFVYAWLLWKSGSLFMRFLAVDVTLIALTTPWWLYDVGKRARSPYSP